MPTVLRGTQQRQLDLKNLFLQPSVFQAGTTSNDDFVSPAVRPDGSIVLAGMTEGQWAVTDEVNFYRDFAAVVLDINNTNNNN